MKKLIALIVLAFLFSCESEECKMCTQVCTRRTEFTDNYPWSVSTFEACGVELEAVDGETLTSIYIINHYPYTIVGTQECKTTCK
jgi:hypothetical protein